jgi:glutaredoxin
MKVFRRKRNFFARLHQKKFKKKQTQRERKDIRKKKRLQHITLPVLFTNSNTGSNNKLAPKLLP